MSKVLFGDNIADMRGKTGGSVYSRNRYGAIRRAKVSPNNPQSSYQMAVRQSFAALSASWRALNQDMRNNWNAGASDFPITNVFGQSKTLTGLALFVSLNQNLRTLLAPPINEIPFPVGLPILTLGDLTAKDDGTFTVTIGLAGDSTDASVVIFGTPAISAGKSTAKGKFRVLAAGFSAGTDQNISTAYESRFAALLLGQKVFIGAKIINSVTGQASPMITAQTIVVAATP